MHDIAEYTDEKEIVDQKAIELAEDFSYEGYQVVRRELFAHLREPAVVIRRDSVTFNTACIAGLEDAVYIQILVNQDNKRMVVRKCEENDKDALRWCVAKPDKRKSRKMTNKIFSAMMYEMMGWNLDCRYKILGHKITFEDETIYVFDLMETEIFLDIKGKKAKKDTESQSTTENASNIEETASSDTDNERSAEEIKRKIEQIDKQKDKLLDLSLKGMIDDFEFKKRNDKFNTELFNLQKQIDSSGSQNLEEEKMRKKLNDIESCLSAKLDIKENLPYLVNLLVDKVIVEKVNGDRKHIKLSIYFDFNTPDIDIDLDMNTKNELKSRSLQTLACRRQTSVLKCSCIDTKQPWIC